MVGRLGLARCVGGSLDVDVGAVVDVDESGARDDATADVVGALVPSDEHDVRATAASSAAASVLLVRVAIPRPYVAQSRVRVTALRQSA